MPFCHLYTYMGRKSNVRPSQVNTLPKAKSQTKDKRAKDRQKYASLRCKVGVAPPTGR
jgi:hypothetical protein